MPKAVVEDDVEKGFAVGATRRGANAMAGECQARSAISVVKEKDRIVF